MMATELLAADSTGSGVWQFFTDPANWTGTDGIWTRLIEQLQISLTALVVAAIIAIPAGVLLGRSGRASFLTYSISNVGRAIPTFALLYIFASWDPIGVGNLAAILALILFAIPPLLTNSYVGVREVDPDAKDSARGMGMSWWQLLGRVEVPLSVPFIFAGVRTTTVQVMATASLAALVGGGGFGRYVVDGFGQQDPVLVLVGVILTAVLCLLTEGILAFAQRLLTPVPMRGTVRVVAAPA
jgi:osmoprotectant transport system permease protein